MEIITMAYRKNPKQTTKTSNRIAQKEIAGAQDFSLVSEFKGYRNKEDITNLPPGYLVLGSQNVLTTVSNRIGVRKGYTLDGQANNTVAGIVGSADWSRHTGDTRNLRSGNTKLQYRYVASAGDQWMGNVFSQDQVYYIDLMTNLSEDVYFNFTDWWDFNVEKKSALLMVNGTSNIYEWSGGVTTLLSATNNTGIIGTLTKTPTAGGSGYTVGDTLSITGGGGTGGTARVEAVVNGAISTVTIANAGGGYAVNDILTVLNFGTQGTLRVTTIGGGGAVTGVIVETQGQDYTTGVNFSVSGGTGTAFTVNVTAIQNQHITALSLLTSGSGYSTGTGLATTGGTGAGATVAITYIAANSITKTGTTTWAEEGFYNVINNRQVMINGNSYYYTGGEGTTTLVGITPDPSGEPVGSVIHQKVVTTPNNAMIDLPEDFENDLIYNLKNQIYIGSLKSRDVYVSKVNDYKDFSFSSPVRLVGEGAIIELDNTPTGFTNQEDTLYITATPDFWYQVNFTISADLTAESLTILPLKTSSLQAAQSQGLISKVKNSVNFVSFEPTLDDLGRVADNLATPQTENISDPIKLDFDSYDFTDGHLFYFRNFKYLALPAEGIVRVFNIAQNYWEAPLFMPIGRFAVIDGELYGHSSETPETFKLFTGYNDNGNPIDARALFSYQNFGTRGNSKYFNEFYSEGYIASNTTITLGITYEIDGCSTQTSFNLTGTDTQVVCLSIADGSLGKKSLGKIPLGGGVSRSITGLPPKFRWIQQMPRKDFYEAQFSYSSLQVDAQWELLAWGPLVSRSMYGNNAIKK